MEPVAIAIPIGASIAEIVTTTTVAIGNAIVLHNAGKVAGKKKGNEVKVDFLAIDVENIMGRL
mgnify:FL=1